jgi:hypothetical protein
VAANAVPAMPNAEINDASRPENSLRVCMFEGIKFSSFLERFPEGK